MPIRHFLLFISAVICIWIGYLGYIYQDLPSTIPTHFNAKGVPDGWGHKNTIWLLPLVGIASIGLIIFIMIKGGNKINYPVKITPENKAQQERMMKQFLQVLIIMMLALFIYISWISVQIGIDGTNNKSLGAGVWIIIGCITVYPIYYLIKASSAK